MVSAVFGYQQEARHRQYRHRHGTPGVLIVDDMPLTLALLEVELEPAGFQQWLADNGNDAIDLYRQHHDSIDVVLLGAEMAALDGPLTLAALQSIDPHFVACFMSGDDEKYTVDDLLDRGALRVFRKPFLPSEVSSFIHRLLTNSDPTAFICDWSGGDEDDRLARELFPSPMRFAS